MSNDRDIAEMLSLLAKIERLRAAIIKTLDEYPYLADGEDCTLIYLKQALRDSGVPWDGDEQEALQPGQNGGVDMVAFKAVDVPAGTKIYVPAGTKIYTSAC